MKIKEEQLIFYCGIPGSGWAKMSALLQCCSKLKINKSDEHPSREEREDYIFYLQHRGAFWDPGMEFGEGFDDIEKNYTKESFIEECINPYTDINQNDNYLIKSHFFAEEKNLNWLSKNFPNNKLIFVIREHNIASDRWLMSMTFTKNYPNYSAWMKNKNEEMSEENMQNFRDLNERHDGMIRRFLKAEKKDVFFVCPSKYTLNKLGFIWNQEGNSEYNMFLRNAATGGLRAIPTYDQFLTFYNCSDLFW